MEDKKSGVGSSSTTNANNNNTTTTDNKAEAGNGWHNTLHSLIWNMEPSNTVLKYIKSQQANNNNNNNNSNANNTKTANNNSDENNIQEEEKSFSLEEEDFNLTPLSLAILKQNASLAKVLLECGASSSNPGSRRTPPIFSAAANGSLDIIKLLVSFKANPLDEDHSQGCSALHVAVDKGKLEVVKYLIEELKIDVNLPASNSNMTPLHYSCSSNQLPIVQYLVSCFFFYFGFITLT